jgi:hypothetical protein
MRSQEKSRARSYFRKLKTNKTYSVLLNQLFFMHEMMFDYTEIISRPVSHAPTYVQGTYMYIQSTYKTSALLTASGWNQVI